MSDLFTTILAHAARQSGFTPGVHLFREVWPALVGPEIARHSRPCGWAEGKLTVEVDADWRPALERQSRRILRRLDDRLPWAIEAVVFVDATMPVTQPVAARAVVSRPVVSRAVGQRRQRTAPSPVPEAVAEQIEEEVEEEQARDLAALPPGLREHLVRIRVYMKAERQASERADSEKDDESC